MKNVQKGDEINFFRNFSSFKMVNNQISHLLEISLFENPYIPIRMVNILIVEKLVHDGMYGSLQHIHPYPHYLYLGKSNILFNIQFSKVFY